MRATGKKPSRFLLRPLLLELAHDALLTLLRLEEEIAALPGGEHIHRCWQCGSCTNSCTVNALNPDFNPRYWIYLIRLGMESEVKFPGLRERAPPILHGRVTRVSADAFTDEQSGRRFGMSFTGRSASVQLQQSVQ